MRGVYVRSYREVRKVDFSLKSCLMFRPDEWNERLVGMILVFLESRDLWSRKGVGFDSRERSEEESTDDE